MSKQERTFEDVFREYTPMIKKIAHKYSRENRSTHDDFVSAMNEALWRAFKTFDAAATASFKTYTKRCLNHAAQDVAKKLSQLRYYSTDNLEAVAGTWEIPDVCRTEQRQLIGFLLKNCDPVTTAIVTEFPKFESLNALGEALGIHHEQVKRKLRYLARHHDGNRFGHYCDYIAV